MIAKGFYTKCELCEELLADDESQTLHIKLFCNDGVIGKLQKKVDELEKEIGRLKEKKKK